VGYNTSISGYIIDPGTGALSSIGQPVPTASIPLPMAVDPTGSFLYVGGRGGTVSAYAIVNDGPSGPRADGRGRARWNSNLA